MATGTYPPSLLPQIAALLDQAPLPIIVSAVKQAAEKTGEAPKKVWRNLKRWDEGIEVSEARMEVKRTVALPTEIGELFGHALLQPT